MTTHIIPPTSPTHTHTMIFLHGRDSTALEFSSEFFESQASDDRTLPEIYPTIKWTFPSSKLRRSARFDVEMSQWFDIWSVEDPSEKMELQVDGLRESVLEIMAIIKQEILLVGPESIILGGISQGCATAIHALLGSGLRLGGFVGLCSWLPFQDEAEGIAKNYSGEDSRKEILALLHGENSSSAGLTGGGGEAVFQTPIFLSHSKDDDVVPVRNGERLRKGLVELGFRVRWEVYEDGGHWIHEPKGVNDIVEFLDGIIVPTSSEL